MEKQQWQVLIATTAKNAINFVGVNDFGRLVMQIYKIDFVHFVRRIMFAVSSNPLERRRPVA